MSARNQSPAFVAGWYSGRFETRPATLIRVPAECRTGEVRRDFWRGHRAGRQVREMLRKKEAS
jgi:hypothetical protein